MFSESRERVLGTDGLKLKLAQGVFQIKHITKKTYKFFLIKMSFVFAPKTTT